MRRGLALAFLVLCFHPPSAVAAEATRPEDALGAIQQALTRYLCHEVYWPGQPHRLGIPLPLKITIQETQFWAWIKELQVIKRARMDFFFLGRLKDGKAVVAYPWGYNVALLPQSPHYLADRRRFESGPVLTTTLTLPTDCTPQYDPPTPQKERMLEAIVNTMQQKLSRWVKQGIAKYPREVTLTIANFNVDSPWTYVLIKSSRKLYTVTLHDLDDDDPEQAGQEYFIKDFSIRPIDKPLLAKIRKHGITRKIVLTP